MTYLELLNQARSESGLSYGALAERIGRGSKGHLSRIFKGQDKPGRNTLLRLALALNLSVHQTHELLVLSGHGGLFDEFQSTSPHPTRPVADVPLNPAPSVV